jgi:hypothetical protein
LRLTIIFESSAKRDRADLVSAQETNLKAAHVLLGKANNTKKKIIIKPDTKDGALFLFIVSGRAVFSHSLMISKQENSCVVF